MARSFTDHPLHRKVERPKSYTMKLNSIKMKILKGAIGRCGNCLKTRACVILKCCSCEFDDNIDFVFSITSTRY